MFQLGDRVQFVDGGPVMRVEIPRMSHNGVDWVQCRWFVGGACYVASFRRELLQVVGRPPVQKLDSPNRPPEQDLNTSAGEQ